jgi:hypothetical protein
VAAVKLLPQHRSLFPPSRRIIISKQWGFRRWAWKNKVDNCQ